MNVSMKLIENRILACMLRSSIWDSNTNVMNVIIKPITNRLSTDMLKSSIWESNSGVMNVITKLYQRNI